MSRRTVLLAAVAALAGCQGPSPSMNSAFKMPTPSFNLLAPYGPPRIPPPGTHSYGQPALLPPAAASVQPYYPSAANIRGVSLPQPPEGDEAEGLQDKVATAAWKSARRADLEEGQSDELTSLVSHESSIAEVRPAAMTTAAGEPPILIPEFAVKPEEPTPLVLAGMPAHDLTRGVSPGQAPTALAALAQPAPVATALAVQPASVSPRSSMSAKSGLVEITDLPPASSSTTGANRGLKRVRGFEQPPVAIDSDKSAPEHFISPQITISASGKETRDAIAAAAIEASELHVKPARASTGTGWKSRYSTDES